MRSTELTLWIFVSILWEGLDHHQKTMVIALDIESPYDRPWCMGRLTKLAYHQVALKPIGQTQSSLSDHKMFLWMGQNTKYCWLWMGVAQAHPLPLAVLGLHWSISHH